MDALRNENKRLKERINLILDSPEGKEYKRRKAREYYREYREKNPTGVVTRNDSGDDTGNNGVTVRSYEDPPKQVHPDDRKDQNKWMGDVMNKRAKTAKARHELKSTPDFT